MKKAWQYIAVIAGSIGAGILAVVLMVFKRTGTPLHKPSSEGLNDLKDAEEDEIIKAFNDAQKDLDEIKAAANEDDLDKRSTNLSDLLNKR